MGAGRKTSTYDVDTGAEAEHARWRFESQQRLLGEKLGGVIFGNEFTDAWRPDVICGQSQPECVGLCSPPIICVSDGFAHVRAVCNNDTYEECVKGVDPL